MTTYTVFRFDFPRDAWDTVAHVVADSAERAIRLHALDGGSVPNLGNYVAIPDDELREIMRTRIEIRIGLDVSASVPESVEKTQ